MNEIYIKEWVSRRMNEIYINEWVSRTMNEIYINEWGSGRMNEIFINEEYNLEEWMRYISVNEDLPWKK